MENSVETRHIQKAEQEFPDGERCIFDILLFPESQRNTEGLCKTRMVSESIPTAFESPSCDFLFGFFCTTRAFLSVSYRHECIFSPSVVLFIVPFVCLH